MPGRETTIPILLDTDIGTDIDDAVALAYLLRQPRAELLGITTVSGEADRRAMLADAVCQAADRADVPIHVGASNSLLVGCPQPHAQQFEALGAAWAHREFDTRPTALEFLRDTIRARPGEITLLAIGPLTNIALLFTYDPELPKMLKQLVIMGGQFFTKPHGPFVGEWNIRCDPHAAAVVFRAPVPRLVAVGLDVTLQCKVDAQTCRDRFAEVGGPLSVTAAMAEVWFRGATHITFHDPLAAAVIFEPGLCQLESAYVQVDTTAGPSAGHTYLAASPAPPHEVAAAVDVQAFFEHYFGSRRSGVWGRE